MKKIGLSIGLLTSSLLMGQYAPQYPSRSNAQPDYDTLSLRPGTFITVRLNDVISSDYNRQGEGFAATLARPVVSDGVTVAEPGQQVRGRVAFAGRGGLGLELTDLTIVDGQTVPLTTQLIDFNARSSNGRDAGVILGTTAAGAAIGGAAGRGTGAGIGAGIGAAIGAIAVLTNQGRPVVLDPESLLTFRLEQGLTVELGYQQQSAYDDRDNRDYQGDGRQVIYQQAPSPVIYAPAPRPVIVVQRPYPVYRVYRRAPISVQGYRNGYGRGNGRDYDRYRGNDRNRPGRR